MKKINFKEVFIPTVSLFIICIGMTLCLALTNEVTSTKIADLAVNAANEARQTVLSNATSFSDMQTSKNDTSDFTYYIGIDESKEEVGYIFNIDEKGYGGTISIMVGVDLEGRVKGVTILDISETAGLGMNAKKESFLSQFIGKSGTIGVSKTSPNDNEIEALTGATITSKAVTTAINEALANFEVVKGGSK